MFFTSDGKINIALTSFANDYVEGCLDSVEQAVFKEYLLVDPELAEFVRKSNMGKRALSKSYRVKAADDFEEKLAQRIGQLKRQSEEDVTPA